MFLGGFITCLFVSIVFFLFGYLIWKKKELSFIAGYNEKTYSGDKDKLAYGVGLLLIGIGVLTLLLPFGLEFIGSVIGLLYGIIIVVGIVACVVYIKSVNK
jgi:UPF0716 family protein affecting phage T7 exclusion